MRRGTVFVFFLLFIACGVVIQTLSAGMPLLKEESPLIYRLAAAGFFCSGIAIPVYGAWLWGRMIR